MMPCVCHLFLGGFTYNNTTAYLLGSSPTTKELHDTTKRIQRHIVHLTLAFLAVNVNDANL